MTSDQPMDADEECIVVEAPSAVVTVLANEQLGRHMLTHFLSVPDQLRFVQPVCR